MARLSEHGIRLSSMSPSFLNSNSTSHTWPFSAVAELTDNASDPGVSARQVWIDVVNEGDHLCLTFTDNGSGMTPNKLHKMLSFGFTEKGPGKASQQAIGVYGNGFKSGSMRLGSDALIFTKNGGCQTVGMLSQTYLTDIKAQAVIVPIVPFSQQTMLQSLVVTEDSEASLAAILTHSIITSQEQIHAHFDSIISKKGTKILIWNLRRAKDGKPEIDFDTDVSDFRLPEIQNEDLKKGLKSGGSLRATQSVPDMHYSLRAYLSILYLKPRTQIILRGKKILATLVSKRLTHIEHDVYKPHFSKEKVKVTFGLNLKNKDHYGIMMYHRNRLIKAYEKVGCQLKASGQRAGVGVIGIIECNFLKPAHNKQDFEYTKEYRLTLGALGLKLNDYWREVIEKKAREREFQALERDENADWHAVDEGPMWLQCEECLKWRNVPVNHYKVAPENWNCSLNPNPHYRSCSSPEEAEDSKELSTPSYQKNHKKQDHPKSRKRESSLEVCEFQEQAAKHQILSRSSSEPSRPTFHSEPDDIRPAGECCTEDNQLEQDQTNADHLAAHDTDTHLPDDAHTQQKNAGRSTVINDKTQNTNNSRCGDEHNVINMELEGREEEQTNERRHKRISGSFYCVKSLQEEPESENGAKKMNPEKQSSTERISVEKSKQDGSSRVEEPGNATLRTTTVLVSPVSRTEGPRSIPSPPEGGEQEANMQRLAALEKEVERLRRLLGLGKTTTQGTMTAVDEKPKRGPASREVGCQTVMAESSTSSSSPTLAPEHQGVLCHRAVSGPTGQLELNMSKKNKTETQSRMRVSDSEACVDSRSSQENLQSIRNNVVVLLTALLPQLDLTGISLETSDVDTILQQILEVNSLKL